jgi:hypothetical protein
MRKPSIPPIPKKEEDRSRFDSSIKESLETMMGRRKSRIEALPKTASLSDVIAKINEIITVMQ